MTLPSEGWIGERFQKVFPSCFVFVISNFQKMAWKVAICDYQKARLLWIVKATFSKGWCFDLLENWFYFEFAQLTNRLMTYILMTILLKSVLILWWLPSKFLINNSHVHISPVSKVSISTVPGWVSFAINMKYLVRFSRESELAFKTYRGVR